MIFGVVLELEVVFHEAAPPYITIVAIDCEYFRVFFSVVEPTMRSLVGLEG